MDSKNYILVKGEDIDLNIGGYDGVKIRPSDRGGYSAFGVYEKEEERLNPDREFTGIKRELGGNEILDLLKKEEDRKKFLTSLF